MVWVFVAYRRGNLRYFKVGAHKGHARYVHTAAHHEVVERAVEFLFYNSCDLFGAEKKFVGKIGKVYFFGIVL